jgi:ABC-type sugar transport system substrate-binding protein
LRLIKRKQREYISIPEDDGNTVANAVQAASQAGTPIFGLERGYEVAQSLGLKSFIGMDDGLAGRDAALYFNSKLSQTVSKALFVRLDDTVNAPVYTKRLEGFRSGLALLNFTKQATVEEVVLSASTPIDSTSLNNALDGCSFELVLVGSASEKLVEKTSLAVKQKGCDASTLVGTFGTSVPIHKSVSAGKLAFAIHQQAYLQGAMSVVHAALYVTTGKHLAPSSESPYGMLRSGPELVTQDTALTDTFQICEADGFPVCPHNKGLDGVTESQCACTERPKMKIAGVLHAVTTDAFWDIVYTAANQAADDFDVELELDRMEPDEADVLHFKMATQIEKLCQEGVDGIFVTIPSDGTS